MKGLAATLVDQIIVDGAFLVDRNELFQSILRDEVFGNDLNEGEYARLDGHIKVNGVCFRVVVLLDIDPGVQECTKLQVNEFLSQLTNRDVKGVRMEFGPRADPKRVIELGSIGKCVFTSRDDDFADIRLDAVLNRQGHVRKPCRLIESNVRCN